MNHFLAAVSLVVLGCGVDSEELGEHEDEVVSANGVSLNGVSLNGVSLNGVSLNGVSLNGVSLNGVSLNGVSLNGVSLNGATLTGATSTGTQQTGASIGATFKGTLSNSKTLTLRIDSAALVVGSTDVWAYGISYSADGGWKPLCGDATVTALQVLGTWNTTATYVSSTTQLTFACRGKAIAKCVEMGYKPWLGRATQLATCVRLLRADYCGDGRTYTKDGQQVNIYDNIGVQADTQAWSLEAEWTPKGARCVSSKTSNRLTTTGNSSVPACAMALVATIGTTCGKFTSGGILVSEVP